jgi:hypothetical protein
MADSMRGSRLGYTSYEIDPGVNAPTKLTTFVCPAEHVFSLPFSIDADEIPDTWLCDCGESALREGLAKVAKKPVKPVKSHLDMLMERRTKKDLESLLKERVDGIRKPKRAS